ncbi:MAG: ion channel [Silvibacterium sp.]
MNLSIFLALLVVTVFVMPALGLGERHRQLSSDLAYTVILVSGVAIAWGQRRLFTVALCFGVFSLCVKWAGWWIQTANYQLFREIVTPVSMTLLCYILLSQVFRRGNMTSMRIQGAIAAYLIIGLAWAHLYLLTNYLKPGSFQGSVPLTTAVAEWYYYSFCTLTTLGYGDIIPIKPVARSLAIAEALFGQLYLAVLIARLMALEVMSWQPDPSSRSGE